MSCPGSLGRPLDVIVDGWSRCPHCQMLAKLDRLGRVPTHERTTQR